MKTKHLHIPFQDYSPFGVTLSGRSWSGEEYRYGFNGKEKDNETFAGAYDFGARILDVRLGRWLSVDGKVREYPSLSGFTFVSGNPILFVDPDGNVIQFKDSFSRTALLLHFQSIFITEDGTSQMANVLMSAGSGSNLDYRLLSNDEKKLYDRNFRRALKQLDPNQRALARGCNKLIKSQQTTIFYAVDPTHSLDETIVSRQTLYDESGGAVTIPNINGTGKALIVVDLAFSKSVTVNDENGNSIDSDCSNDEAIAHEMI